jgi:hypothetical protein
MLPTTRSLQPQVLPRLLEPGHQEIRVSNAPGEAAGGDLWKQLYP